MDVDSLKRAAGEAAATLIEDGMVVGLGTGSTAKFAVEAIGARVQAGLKILGIPTSEQTAAQARSLGIPLGELTEERRVDLTIDGADEVDIHNLDLIKGRGGALLREKIVASVSDRFVIVVDESKLVERLGRRGFAGRGGSFRLGGYSAQTAGAGRVTVAQEWCRR